MAVSDQLSRLSARTKELEDRAMAAKSKAKADLEQEVESAREAAQVQGDALRQSAEAHKGNISAWWDSVERSWNDHLAAVRKDFDDKRAAHDLKSARGRRCLRSRLRVRGGRRGGICSARRHPRPHGGRRDGSDWWRRDRLRPARRPDRGSSFSTPATRASASPRPQLKESLRPRRWWL